MAELVVVLDSDDSRRTRVTRFLYENSRAVEPYASFDELRAFWPNAGMILVHDDEDALQSVFRAMLKRGCWLPAIVYAPDPQPSRIVDVILMGAIDYLSWPVTAASLLERFRLAAARQRSFSERRRRASHACRLVGKLSSRERDVLFRLSNGSSNKQIARELQISPRTIEVHRANMMDKLGVAHLGEAVSIALHSGLSPSQSDEEDFDAMVIQQ